MAEAPENTRPSVFLPFSCHHGDDLDAPRLMFGGARPPRDS
jgi:hypothetical protein